MARLTRNLLLAAAVFAGPLVTAFQVEAFEPLCIRETTDQYREAVRLFDDEVDRSRSGVQTNRFEVRRLRQQADRFHHAVRNHNDYFRYASAWQELSNLHFRVERSFAAGCRQSDPRLFHAWRLVSLQFDRLSEAVEFHAYDGRGRQSVWDHRGGHDRFGHDRFGRDWHQDDFRGRDQFSSRHSVARPSFGPSVLPIQPVSPIRGFAPQVDPRTEAAAAITGAILQRLLN
jgi:hypothetical protein